MSVLVKGMNMPKDCPMCPMAHWNAFNMFSGCEAVPDKKYAIRDPEYANSDHRPGWCPLVDVPPHGRLIDVDVEIGVNVTIMPGARCKVDLIAPTVIEAEEGE